MRDGDVRSYGLLWQLARLTSFLGTGGVTVFSLACLLQGCGEDEGELKFAQWSDPCAGTSGSDGTAEPDHAIFTRVLQKYVTVLPKNGVRTSVVDYEGLRKDTTDLRDYLGQFCTLDLSSLSVAQRLATLINSYNAMMLAIVVQYNPTKSVLDLSSGVPEGSIWKHEFGTIGGSKVSLDDIEHSMIRGGLSAEAGMQGHIHAAVNCASLSCPNLRNEAFEADRLEAQLTDQVHTWLDEPTKNEVSETGSLQISHIFKWYRGDFVAASGSVQAWLRTYGAEGTAWKDIQDSAAISYKGYDWGLNSKPAGG